MKFATCLVAIALLGLSLSVPGDAKSSSIHTTYHWHLQQPIYWPARSAANPNTYQKAAESIALKGQQGGHPQNNLDSIFGKPDRVNDYTGTYPLAAINSVSSVQDMGAQVSYSGCLIENINSLSAANKDGYGPNWPNDFKEAREKKTSGGFPKLDLVSFTYHHALLPLVDKNAIAKQIAIHKLIYAKTWGSANGTPQYSKGFFPAEMAFTERQIPTLVEAGLEWVIVSNNHISRSCQGYPYSEHGDNIDPPNPADQTNPAQSNYFNMSISRGCVPNNAVPFSYQPHYAQYTDPLTGKTSKIIVVPAAQAMGWQDGYGCYSTQDIQNIAHLNDPTKPMLVLFAHDGDNAFGGGYSYYNQCVQQFVNQATSNGYQPSTIQQYLNDWPVDENDIVHVEDGAWVNPPDFGAPQCTNWNWPLLPEKTTEPGQFDVPSGWAIDERNWAIITAAENYAETAEQVSGGVRLSEIQEPTANVTQAELAWHFYLPATTSGYMYYGSVLDMPVKQTVACNLAFDAAKKAITANSGTADKTPPSIWTLQRLPWNPGGYGMGELWGYKYTPQPQDFYVYTFVADVSGIASVDLMYRVDDDGVNPTTDNANELYDPEAHGLSGVGPWQKLPMLGRSFPTGNVYNRSIDLTCNATGEVCLPDEIADEYYIQVPGSTLVGKLIDYYVTAVDKAGNTKNSDIYHVVIGDGTVPSPSPSPSAPRHERLRTRLVQK